MKVLYTSTPPFFDMDLSLVKHLSDYGEMFYLLDISPYVHKSSVMEIERMYGKGGIYPAEIYPELSGWGDFIKPEQFYVLNNV